MITKIHNRMNDDTYYFQGNKDIHDFLKEFQIPEVMHDHFVLCHMIDLKVVKELLTELKFAYYSEVVIKSDEAFEIMKLLAPNNSCEQIINGMEELY